MRSLPRLALSWLVSTAVAVTLVATTATPAHASIWQHFDGFENSPETRWSFSGVGTHFGNFDGTGGSPRTGAKFADLTQWDAGWSAVGRTIHLTPAQSHATSCSAKVWMASHHPSSPVNFEIINPVTWEYVALKRVNVAFYPWQSFTVGPWAPGPVDVVLRIAVTSSGTTAESVMVDDVIVSCTYY